MTQMYTDKDFFGFLVNQGSILISDADYADARR